MAILTVSTDVPAAAARTSVRWRVFAIVFVLVVLNLIDRTALSIAMPTIAREFAPSPTMQGLVLSAFFPDGH